MRKTQIKFAVKTAAQAEVTFTKTDGTERVMICTLDDTMIPEIHRPVGDKTRQESVDVTKVFDLEKNAWRSFRNDSVTNIVVMNRDGEVLDVITQFED